jgi:hypothetical protein
MELQLYLDQNPNLSPEKKEEIQNQIKALDSRSLRTEIKAKKVIKVSDFELLSIIGKGAFGEVSFFF